MRAWPIISTRTRRKTKQASAAVRLRPVDCVDNGRDPREECERCHTTTPPTDKTATVAKTKSLVKTRHYMTGCRLTHTQSGVLFRMTDDDT